MTDHELRARLRAAVPLSDEEIVEMVESARREGARVDGVSVPLRFLAGMAVITGGSVALVSALQSDGRTMIAGGVAMMGLAGLFALRESRPPAVDVEDPKTLDLVVELTGHAPIERYERLRKTLARDAQRLEQALLRLDSLHERLASASVPAELESVAAGRLTVIEETRSQLLGLAEETSLQLKDAKEAIAPVSSMVAQYRAAKVVSGRLAAALEADDLADRIDGKSETRIDQIDRLRDGVREADRLLKGLSERASLRRKSEAELTQELRRLDA